MGYLGPDGDLCYYDDNDIIESNIMEKFEIISAAKANKMLQEEKDNDNQCLAPIIESIKKAIKHKDNHCYISDQEEYILDKLRKLGYTVGDLMHGDRYYEPSMRKISW